MKELVRMSDPDVLCFLEGKTDIQHLTQLDGFEEWVHKQDISTSIVIGLTKKSERTAMKVLSYSAKSNARR